MDVSKYKSLIIIIIYTRISHNYYNIIATPFSTFDTLCEIYMPIQLPSSLTQKLLYIFHLIASNFVRYIHFIQF